MAKQNPRRDQLDAGQDRRSRLVAALEAGAVAIGVNTALLAGADSIGFTTARGGLLRLLKDIAGGLAPRVSLEGVWKDVLAPATSGALFQTAFHVVVGLLMAIFYAYLLEPLLPGRPLVKGLIYAALVWLLNAFAVLPLIGEGIAGSRQLDIAGMVGFAVIHTVFFVLLAVLYAPLRAAPQQGPSPAAIS
jgi:hypothetical protein